MLLLFCRERVAAAGRKEAGLVPKHQPIEVKHVVLHRAQGLASHYSKPLGWCRGGAHLIPEKGGKDDGLGHARARVREESLRSRYRAGLVLARLGSRYGPIRVV